MSRVIGIAQPRQARPCRRTPRVAWSSPQCLPDPASPTSARTYGVSQGWISRLDDSRQNRGRGGVRAPIPGSRSLPERHRSPDRRPGPRASQEALRGRPGRRRRHHRLAPAPPPPHRAVAGHDQPDPGPGRRRRRGPLEATQVLPPSASKQPSPTRPGNRTSPTTGSPTPEANTGARHRDPDLDRRPLPPRRALHRPRAGHRPSGARRVPRGR